MRTSFAVSRSPVSDRAASIFFFSTCPASSCASISGSFRYDADPHTSETCGARSKIFSPSCCATHPANRLALPLQLFVIGQPVEDFLLRLIANRAGVVQDQVRLLDRLDLP